MKNMLSLLLLVLGVGYAWPASAQAPKVKPKRAFSHYAESSKGKNSKARFRRENKGAAFIDLHPKSLEKFKTAKANKNYKYSKGH